MVPAALNIACCVLASISSPRLPGGTLNHPKSQVFAVVLLSSMALVAQTTKAPAKPSTGTTSGAPAAKPTAPANAQAQPPAAAAESNVAPDATVITINGVCEVTPSATTRPAKAGTDCKTQISRAEFEKLVKTVAPNAPPTARRQIASTYVQILSAANEGAKLGVENDPDFAEQMTLMKLQILGQ